MEAAVQPARVRPEASEPDALHQAITRRAHELWELRGRVDGHAEEDWARAEAEVRRAWHRQSHPRTAFVVVKVGEFTYTGEYDPQRSGFYQPGDLGKGAPVPVRLEDARIFLRLCNGRELETKIVRRSLG